jgi:hypothetical protein
MVLSTHLPEACQRGTGPKKKRRVDKIKWLNKLSGSLWGQSERRTNPCRHPDVGHDISEIENISIRA